MDRNSFKELQKEQASRFEESARESVKESVTSSIGLFKFFGDIIELYVPRVMSLFVDMSSGEAPRSRSRKGPARGRPRYPHSNE